jgi:hypothetical protein
MRRTAWHANSGRSYEKKCEFFQSIRGKTRSRNATSATAGWCMPFVSTPARYALASRESQPYLHGMRTDAHRCHAEYYWCSFSFNAQDWRFAPSAPVATAATAATAQCHPWVGVAALRCAAGGRAGGRAA